MSCFFTSLKRVGCIGLLGLLCMGQLLAQSALSVSGRVTDDSGQGLPGVSVVLKNSSSGTTTNADGDYRISVSDGAAKLVFSFVGYVSQEVTVANRSTLNVKLLTDSKTLNEVVVIAYGEQSVKTVTSAVTKIEGEAISRQTVSTPGEALAALAPGVSVQSEQGGAPGNPPSIVIRGGSSLGTSTDPLYVVDGYPLQDPAQFNLINPQDIETISVLKDAASTAIYGSRAANGVIIVTTKRGKAGKTAFTVSAYTGFQRISKKIDVLNRDEYIDWQTIRARSRAYNTTTGMIGTPVALPASFTANTGNLPDTDWQDVIYRDAVIRNVQVSASGGTDKARFNLSAGYFKQDGVLLGSAYDRFNVRFNLDANLSPKLKVGVSLAPSYAVQDKQATAGQYNGTNASANVGTRSVPNATSLALLVAPTMPVYIDNGDYAQPNNLLIGPNNTVYYTVNAFNPKAIVDLNQNTITSYRVFANTFLEWAPLPGLRLKTAGGVRSRLIISRPIFRERWPVNRRGEPTSLPRSSAQSTPAKARTCQWIICGKTH